MATRIQLGFRPELNGLRGIAVIVVVCTHAFDGIFPGGALGVDIFFALSGFLITSLLAGEWADAGRIHLERFWMRRVLRLVPALLVFLVAAVVVAIGVGTSVRTSLTSAALSIFYVGNIARVIGLPFAPTMGHLWSLAIEEQFYLLWPPVFYLLMRLGISRRTILMVTILPVLVVPFWRTILYFNGADYARLKLAPDTRADVLLVGCVLGLAFSWQVAPKLFSSRLGRALLWPAAGFLVYWWIFGGGPAATGELAVWGYTAIAVSAGVLLVNSLDPENKRFRQALCFRPLVWFGTISYGLYLWHLLALNITRYLARHLLPSSNAMVVAAIAIPAALLVTELSWRYVEAPFLRKKIRFAEPRTNVHAAAGSPG